MSKHLLLSAFAYLTMSTAFAQSGLVLEDMSPAPKSTVKSFSKVTLTFKLSNGENMVQGVPEKIADATICKDGGTAVQATEWQMVEAWPMNQVDLIFPTQTEAGNYTMTIPAGVVGEYAWNDAAGDFAIVDGMINEPISASYTVDPAAAGILDNYRLTPASGETVGNLSEISLIFPEAPYDMEVDESKSVTLSNGTKTISGEIGGWGNERSIMFSEAVSADGEWTLVVEAGAFSASGETSPEITAVYTVNTQMALEYTVSPANGTTQELPDGHAITVTFDFANATTVDYEPWEDGSSTGGDTAGFRVTYGGVSVPRVKNAMTEYGYQTVDNWGDPVFMIRLSPEVFNVNGKLEIEADKGAFTVDGLPSPEISYSLNFGKNKNYEYTLSPSNDTALDQLGTFTIEFPTAETAKYVEGAYIVLRGTRSYQIYEVEEVKDAAHPTFTINFDPAPSSEIGGSYELMIDKGAFILDNSYQSPMIKRTYKLNRTSEIDMTCTPSPTEGRVLAGEYGTYVAFVFSEDETVYYSSLSSIEVLFDGEPIPAEYREVTFAGMDGNKLLINIYGDQNPFVGKEGTLSVTIPAGVFTISGQEFEGITHTWEVVKPKEYTWYTIPADGETVNTLDEVTIVFENAETAGFEAISNVNLRATDYSSYFNATAFEATTVEGHPAYKFTFDPAPEKAGDYILLINYGAFLLDRAQETPNIEVTFKFDPTTVGINGIATDNDGLYTVVSLEGRTVLRNATADRVKSLPMGFYIINGKKTVIR